MKDTSEWEDYINDWIGQVTNQLLHITRTNLQANMYLAKFARAALNARSRREELSKKGEHIPPFLIADITKRKNQKQMLTDEKEGVSDEEWVKLFKEAEKLGMVFIMLRGGEPLLCPEVLKGAARIPKILFPILTDGALIDDYYVKLFDKNRNLIPFFRLESGDIFREHYHGIHRYSDYDPVVEKMEALREHRIIFGSVIQATADNLDQVIQKDFLNKLYDRGCRAVFYVNAALAPKTASKSQLSEEGQKFFSKQLRKLKDQNMGMLLAHIPEDGKAPGGCFAAGRGFLHITATGDVQPCPVSPFHDRNIRVYSLREALRSSFFSRLQESHLLEEEAEGTCALAGKEELLKLIL